ncbi:MAG: hypothetical protein K2W93_09815 [Burkholderiaceae bacterium]|nr:hypothetical protein [Burkholderiaceae bacterium]
MLQTLNFNGPRQANGKASFFRYESGSAGGADESIRVRADGNDLGLFLPGDYVKLPIEASRWEILPTTPTTSGLIRLGLGEVGSARMVGNVRVIDGERDKVAAGVCFRGGAAAAGGTNGPFVQVFNPVASTVNLFIQAVRMGSLNADSYGIGTSGSQLPNLSANATTNLNRSGPASAGQIRTDNTGTVQTGTRQIAAGYVQASSDSTVIFPRPLLIRPGEAAYCYLLGVTNNLRATFEWEEWPV